ncbi:MAG TPA: putative Ig domain-containing protein [Pengzhenrongella sp.]
MTSGWDPPTVTALDPLPEGLTLTQSADLRTWQITGTPTRDARGSRYVRLELTNAYGVTATEYLDITVTASPVWNVPSGRTIVVERGVPIDRVPFGVTAYPVGSMTYWGSAGLGFTRDVWTSTGVTGWITGTPSASGNFSICVSRGLACVGPVLTTWFRVQDRPAIAVDPAVTTPTGSPVSIPITVTGSPAAALTVTGLPAGLHADPTGTGVWTITGTPDRSVLGEHTITLTADNGLTRTATIALTITGAPEVVGPVTVTAPLGEPLTGTALEATGFPLPVFSLTAGALPPGVSLADDGSGGLALSGTPTTLGSWTVAITATNMIGAASTSLTIDVVQAPEFAEAGPVELTLREGDPFSYTALTTGYPAPAWAVTGPLPAGVTFVDGVLSGTPAVGSADAGSGRFEIVLEASNAHGSDTLAISLVVSSAPTFLAGLPTATIPADTPSSYTFTTGGWNRPTVTLLDPLPTGLSLNDGGDADPTTWSITGTVARALMGPHPVRIALDNAFGVRTIGTLTVAVTAPFVWEPFTTDVVVETGVPITAIDLVGTGYPIPMDYNVRPLPEWLGYTPTLYPRGPTATSITFHLTGTPITPGPGTVTVEPAFGLGAPASVRFHVTDRPVLTAPATQTVLTDTAVDIPVTVSGSPVPSVTATGLPTGLTVVAGAPGEWHISGTVGRDTFGTYDVTLTADNGLVATRSLVLTVEGLPALDDATVTTYLDEAADAVVRATGDPLPTLAVTAGSLPPGLTATDDGFGGLAFTGTPTTPGRWEVTVTATNEHGDASATLIVEVRAAPVFSDTLIEHTLREGDPVDFTAAATGYPAHTVEIASGVLPDGLTLSPSGRITGTPALGSADAGSGRYELQLRAWNGEGEDTVPVTLVVLSRPSFPAGLPTMSIDADTAATYTFTTGGWDRPAVTLLDPLPGGLSLDQVDETTWQITGTVTRDLRGPHTVRVALDNAFGVQVVQSLRIEVHAALVWGPAPTSIVVETGIPITPLTLTSSGYAMPWHYGLPEVPSWIRRPWYSDGETAFAERFEGTPTTAGPARLTLTPWGVPGPDLTVTFLVTDRPVITAPTSVTATAGDLLSVDVTVAGSPTSELTATGLPTGLSLEPDATAGTWQITGTPLRDALGEHTVTLTAENGLTSTLDMTLTVIAGALLTAPTTAITTRLHEPMAPVAWTASGYPAPDVELVGDLPPGVLATTVPAGVTVSGTPNTPGSWEVVVRTTNAHGTDEVTVTITVAELPTFADETLDLVMVEGVPATVSLPLRGFPFPTVDVAGAIPGMTVTHVPGSDPVLSGTPEAGSAGDQTLTFTARNTISGTEQTDVVTVNVRVDAQPQFRAGTEALVATVGSPASRTILLSGAPEATVVATGLPAGLALTRAGVDTWTLAGTPAAGTGGRYTAHLTADNGILDPVTADIEITVREPVTMVHATSGALREGVPATIDVATRSGWPTATTLRVDGTLPDGLRFVDDGDGTGRVVGTPAAGTAGRWSVTLVADNGVSPTRVSLVLTITAAPVAAPVTAPVAATTVEDPVRGSDDGEMGDDLGEGAGGDTADSADTGGDGSDESDDAVVADGGGPRVTVTVTGNPPSPWWWALLSLLLAAIASGVYVSRRMPRV